MKVDKDNKKKRILKLNFNIHKNTEIRIGKKYRIEIGNLSDDGIINSVDSILSYNSESGKLRTIYQFISEKQPILDEIDLFKYYDRVFVADTNSKNHKNCVGVIGELVWYKDTGFAIKKLVHYAFEIEDSIANTVNPEKYTWNFLVNEIKKLDNQEIRYGIIVDSELGNLFDYNNGKPFLDNAILPSNIKFIYATANKNDTLFNWAIKQCDKAASKLCEEYYVR